MFPIELLTQEDRTKIKDWVNAFSGYTNGPTTVYDDDIPIILDCWNQEKSQNLLPLFGGNDLILRQAFTYEVPESSIRKEISAVRWSYPATAVIRYLECKLYNHFITHDSEFNYEYIHGATKLTMNEAISTLKSETAMMKNAIQYSFSFEFDDKVVKFPQGMKYTKFIRKLLDYFPSDEMSEEYEKLRVSLSMATNQRQQTGELCLSIHPLDYMTMSDNDSGWSSCMRWGYNGDDAGDYRLGTVDDLNSEFIIVAYLHNPKSLMTDKHCYDGVLPEGWSWNNKKWRCLFRISPEEITEIKGYPYDDKNLTKACLNWLRALAKENLGWEYEDRIVNIKDKIALNEPVPDSDIKEILISHTAGNMYNDFGALKEHLGYFNAIKVITSKRCQTSNCYNFNTRRFAGEYYTISLPYGGYGTCMRCGRYIDNPVPNSVLCDECEPRSICPCCNEVIASNDDVYYVENYEEPICQSCWDEYAYHDDIRDVDTTTEVAGIRLCVGMAEEDIPVLSSECIYTGINIPFRESGYEYSYDWKEYFSAPCSYDADGENYINVEDIKPEHRDYILDLFGLNSETSREREFNRMIGRYY